MDRTLHEISSNAQKKSSKVGQEVKYMHQYIINTCQYMHPLTQYNTHFLQQCLRAARVINQGSLLTAADE